MSTDAGAATPRAPGARAQGWGALALFATLAAFVFRDCLFFGRMLFQRDIDLVWNGAVDALVRVVAAGSAPLWNPYPAYGQPFLAVAIDQLLYPTTWLNLILQPATYYSLFVVSHVTFAAMGAYALARRLGVSWLGGVVAGCAYAFSGPYLSVVHMANMLAAGAWLPWCWLAAHASLAGAGRRYLLLWGAALAMTLLAGSPEITLMAGFGVLLALPELARAGASARWRAARALALAAILGLGLSAAQWLPTLDLQRRSARASLVEGAQVYWSQHPLGLLQSLAPVLLDDVPLTPVVRDELFSGRDPFLHSIYLGLAAFGLVLAGLVVSGNRHRGVLATIGVLALALALGRYSPGYDIARALLPPLHQMRFPVKFVLAAALAWSALAGLGVEAMARSGRRRLVAAALVSLPVAVVALAALASARPDAPLWRFLLVPAEVFGQPYEQSPALVAAWRSLTLAGVVGLVASLLLFAALLRRPNERVVVALALLSVVDLLAGLRTLNPTVPRELLAYRPPALAAIPSVRPNRTLILDYDDPRLALRHLGRTNAFTYPFDLAPELLFALPRAYPFSMVGMGHWGIEGFSTDVPFLRDHDSWIAGLLLQSAVDAPYYLRLLQAAGIRYLITLHEDGLPAPLELLGRTPGPFGRDIFTFRVPDPLPRAFVVGSARRGEGLEAWKLIAAGGVDPRREVLLAEGANSPANPAFQGEASLVEGRPDHLTIDVESNAPGYVVVLEGYDPGWKARVDDRPARVERANSVFRAVAVPPGRHRVELAYRPWPVSVGIALSVISLAALLIAATRPIRAS